MRLALRHGRIADAQPDYVDFRTGDVRHSQADISKAVALLGYAPSHDLQQGLEVTTRWFLEELEAGA
jgi:UDP-N-acetylglucosamine 4-epimerase